MRRLIVKAHRFILIIAMVVAASAGWSTPVQAQSLPVNGTLFHSNLDGDNDIYLINNSGTTLTKLTKNSTQEDNPAWSPDGARIVYESYVAFQTRSQLYTMELATGIVRQLTDEPNISHRQPVFSPDGSTIAFIGKDDTQQCLRVYKLKTQEQTTLKCGEPREGYELPAWSPDGQQIMFTSITGEFNRFAININDLSVRLVVPGAYTGIWSPDGQYIAFSSIRNKPTDTEQIFIMRSDGSEVRQVTYDSSRSRRAVAWYPHGNRLLTVTFDAPDYTPDLRSIQSDGTQEIILTSTPNASEISGPGATR